MKSLSVVLPCYNEEDSISAVIPRLLERLYDLQAREKIQEFEIIVVDDNSTDRSVQRLSQFNEIQIVKSESSVRGYGKALKEGFRRTKGDWIGFLDLDNSYRPEDIEKFVKEIQTGQFDFVMGQRPLDDKGMSFVRGLGNWLYVFLAKILYGASLEDVCSGYRFFSRKMLAEILSVPENGLDFSIHLTLRVVNGKTKLKCIPIQYDRRIGKSKLSVFSDGWAFLKVLCSTKVRGTGVVEHSRI